MIELQVLALLFVKHFVVDFPLQKPYQWMNKGTYGHPGGLLHAGLHGLGTFAVFLPALVDWHWAVYCGIIDLFVHYHVDWLKMNLNKHYGWRADTHEQFWVLLGADQLAHALTYVGLVALMAG
jgi:hypothetical protein